MLITHRQIYLNALGHRTTALLVRGGRVVATGDRARALYAPGEPTFAPEGACLFPALADAHCHLWGVGMRAGSVNLSGAAGPEEVYERLKRYFRARHKPSPSGWVLGHGWDQYQWGAGKALHRFELDAIFPDIPVCLHRVDRHAIVCNTEALRRARIVESHRPTKSARSVYEQIGTAQIEDASGALTGFLVDPAMMPVLDAIPPAGADEDRQLFEETARVLRGHGVASAHMALTGVNRLGMLRAMADADELPIRLMTMIDGTDPDLDEVLSLGPVFDPDAWLAAKTIKFFADGALGSGGAYLFEPYRDGTRGMLMHDSAELSATISGLIESGWQVAVHGIGDAAAHEVLDAFAQSSPAMRRKVRPRLEHCQMLIPEDCRRMRTLSVVASIQPIHLRSDASWAPDILSEKQLERLFPWRGLAENLADPTVSNACPMLAAGSDYPIDDPNPWHGIATALTRETADGEAFYADKALNRVEILHAYTSGAAYAAHWEHRIGSLYRGFAADFLVLSDDPFCASPDELWHMDVLEMWIEGKKN